MANPPWEPYPERKKRLEERGRRPKNKQKRGGESSKHAKNMATTNSISSTSSADTDLLPTGRDEEIDSTSCDHEEHGDGKGSLRHTASHIRVRPDDCWCLREGACGDEDGCCMEDLPGVTECPCQQRINTADVFEVSSRMVAVVLSLARAAFMWWLACGELVMEWYP